MKQVKQVIVVRKDLNMRKGKMCAQVAHGSLGVTLENLEHPDVKEWLSGAFTKICLGCKDEDELLELESFVNAEGIINCLITDSGKTEFHGEPTLTVLAIGPADPESIDKITGHLKLL